MNYTVNRTNYKIPSPPLHETKKTPDPPSPVFPPSLSIAMPNNRPLDPNVLGKIRELETFQTPPPVYVPPNPFRKNSGLLFRDILGRASPANCKSCDGAK